MKKLLLSMAAIFLVFVAFSQTTLYEDNFDSYSAGDYISVETPDWWVPWSGPGGAGTGEDGIITSDFAMSGSNSLEINESDGQTDLLWLFGDKISGVYDCNFWIYIPSGKYGYYNFQHFEAPGTEWAIQVHFTETGEFQLFAGASDPFTTTYTPDTWIHLEHHIDLDNDEAELYIDGTLFHTWQWSLQSFGDPGTNQLGSVDFYAGGQSVETLYYVDDVEYIEVIGATDPIMVTSPLFFNVQGTQGEVTTETLTIENIGFADLTWETHPIYDLDTDRDIVLESNPKFAQKNLAHFGMAADPTPQPGGLGPVYDRDEATLRYDDGTNSSAIGWNSVPIDVSVAARFLTTMTVPYAGMYITSVDIFINDPSEDYILKIWGHGSNIAPGDLLLIQAITPDPYSWNTIQLTDPVLVNGGDIWVGYSFTQVDLVYTPGTDAGPQNPNGDWVSTGPGWGHLGPDLPYNWNIAAYLEGDPIEQWLSTSPASGTLAPGESIDVDVLFDATMLEGGTYAADLLIKSNDPNNLQVFKPCAFTVEASLLQPPTDLVGEVDCLDAVLNWSAPGGGGTTTEVLAYDNDVATGSYSYEGYTMSTHMSPSQACTLLEVHYYTTLDGSAITFNMHLFEWAGSEPSTTVFYTQEAIEGIDEDWLIIDVSGENLEFTGDFVAGFGSINPDVYLGYDADLNNGRSWDFDNTTPSWTAWNEAYLIRALVEYENGDRELIGATAFDATTQAAGFINMAKKVHNTTYNPIEPIDNRAYRALLGYNVYRDGNMLNVDPVTATTYTDEMPGIGAFEYTVTAVYDEGESPATSPAMVEIEELDPVNNLMLDNEPGSSDVYLTWDPPGVLPMWIHWDDGVNADGIGLTEGGSFYVAARFSPTDIADFDGMSLTKMAIFPRDPDATYEMYVWEGANAGTVLHTQALTGLAFEQWNEIDLDMPVALDVTKEFWFGYMVTHNPGTFPAGVDAGPAIPEYGDMISTDGVAWSPLSGFGLDYNWNIQGYLETVDAVFAPSNNLTNVIINNTSNELSVVKSKQPTPFNPSTRDLMGYNVYRNEELIAGPITDLFYDDMGLANDYYEYCVTALWGEDCESEPVCEEVWITVGIDDMNNDFITIYPNPANTYIKVEVTQEVSSITMLNYVGQVVYFNNEVNTNQAISINTSGFEAGVYFVRIESQGEFFTEKVTVK